MPETESKVEQHKETKTNSDKEKYKDKHGEEDVLSEKEAVDISNKLKTVTEEIKKVVKGQDKVISEVLLCLICDNHALLEGVPGLAKSLLVETISKTIRNKIHQTFRRFGWR